MNELRNRINTQRNILKIVNGKPWLREPLFSLSQLSIERWASANQLSLESDLVKSLFAASEKLFFLANKSQEEITEEYRGLSDNVLVIINRIETIISSSLT